MIKTRLSFIADEVRQISDFEKKPKKLNALRSFFRRATHAFKVAWTEREILIFAILQWMIIGLGYFVWIKIFDWIPEKTLSQATQTSQIQSYDIVFTLWSLVIIAIVTLPLGMLSACIGATHVLRRQNQASTIAASLQLVLPQILRIWSFSFIDAWITMNQILKRLPKKNNRTSKENSVLSEALYYAWKLGTIGIMPALITGRELTTAGKDSVLFVKKKFVDTSVLRVGYSLCCWVIGIGTYIGTLFFLILHKNGIDVLSTYYLFYWYAGVPILVATGFILLFLSPVYIISSVDIYMDYLQETKQQLVLPKQPSKLTNFIIAFLVFFLMAAVIAMFFFRDQLGITALLE